MWRQYLFFFQSADWKSTPACISVNSYPHWALGSADSPYHGGTQNFPWSVVLHHPLFPPSPSSVISFPKLFCLTAIHLLYYFTSFSCVTFLFLWASAWNYQVSNLTSLFPFSFLSMLISWLFSKRKPLCCQKKSASSLMLDSKLSWYQLGNTHTNIAPYSQHPSTLRHSIGRWDKPMRQKHGSLNNYQPSKGAPEP